MNGREAKADPDVPRRGESSSLTMGEKSIELADRFFSFISPRTILMLFLRCLLLGLAFAFYQVLRRIKKEKEEVIKFMRDVEQKLKAERDREELKEKAESRREEKEELQKFPDELFMKVATRMWEVIQESTEKLITACNEQGTKKELLSLEDLLLNRVISTGTDRVLYELTGKAYAYNGITYSQDINVSSPTTLSGQLMEQHLILMYHRLERTLMLTSPTVRFTFGR